MAQRPLFYVALAFGCGILLQHLAQPPAAVAMIGFSLCLAVALVAYQRKQTRRGSALLDVCLLLACTGAGMLRTCLAEAVPPHHVANHVNSDTEILLGGTVLETPRPRGESAQFRCAVQSLYRLPHRPVPLRGHVLVSGRELDGLTLGEQVVLHGRLELPDGARNPGAFDHRAYLRAQGMVALFRCTSPALVWRSGPAADFSFWRTLEHARARLSARLQQISSGQALALLQGLLLGVREDLDREVMQDFARTGLIHILAVSGLHVGFIVAILVIAAGLLGAPRRWQTLLVITGLAGYACLTGLKPPVVRASLMAGIMLVGQSFERDGDLFNSLGAAALVLLAFQPLQLFQLGFQLSFAAVAGIATIYSPLHKLFSRLLPVRGWLIQWAASLFAVSVAAQLATLPFVVSTQARLPVTALWGNLVVIPAAFLAVATGILACVSATFSEFVAQAYGAVADFSAQGILLFVGWLARQPLAYVEGIQVPALLWPAYVLALTACLCPQRRVRLWLWAAVLVLMNAQLWHAVWHFEPRLRATFFDVDQGDAILLEFPRNRNLLIDTGPLFHKGNAGERVLLPHLTRYGIRHLDAVVISHPHADHLGGLAALLPAIRIDTVYHCGVSSGSRLEEQCRKLMDSLQVPYRVLQAGDRLAAFAPAQIWALRPSRVPEMVHNLNDASIVLKVVFGGTTMLFTGDAERWSESHMLQYAHLLNSQLLKIGHHGSRTSSTPAFLAAVQPRWAVASVGRRNKFGHPHPEVMARYDSLGIGCLRTDRNGAVIFTSNGKTLQRRR